ncbi:MAG: hypothetical protein BWY25_03040 [Chloroflexi bacterium ADurb.Bin222]|nr:MAG: hypothetical protein BWY25_03040 [Chloroflexi bacterium ADurb.Bin222]
MVDDTARTKLGDRQEARAGEELVALLAAATLCAARNVGR